MINTTKTPANQFLNCSEQSELNYWAQQLGVKPEVLKTAVRASRNNSIESVKSYVKSYKVA